LILEERRKKLNYFATKIMNFCSRQPEMISKKENGFITHHNPFSYIL